MVYLGVYIHSHEALAAIDPAVFKCLHERTAAVLPIIMREEDDSWEKLNNEPAYISSVMKAVLSTKSWEPVRQELMGTSGGRRNNVLYVPRSP